MPNTNDSHGESKIIFEDDDWLIVEPFDYNSYIYYAPDNMKSKWDEFREGDVYFIVDKDSSSYSGLKTYMIFKYDDNFTYYWWDGREIDTKKLFIDDFPTDITNIIKDVIGDGKVYKLLMRIKNGESVSVNEMKRADDCISDYKATPKSPHKGKITLYFYDDEYIELFNPSEDDKWAYQSVTSYNGYQFEDYYSTLETFKEGYMLGDLFLNENFTKLKKILSIISPKESDLKTDEKEVKASLTLDELFGNEIEDIVGEYVNILNNCKNRSFLNKLEENLCDAFEDYYIFTEKCLNYYFTSVGFLIKLYDTVGDTSLSIKELLFNIGSELNKNGWGDYFYEQQCDDFDFEYFNNYVSKILDKIFDNLVDSDDYMDIEEYFNMYDTYGLKYNINGEYKTKYGKEFGYKGIRPEDNKILISVLKKDGNEEIRSYSEEEFNNFMVSPELFESRRRIYEQVTENPSVNFIKYLSKVDPSIFTTKKPLSYLKYNLDKYKSKNPGVNLNMNMLIKQLSTPQSIFKLRTFDVINNKPSTIGLDFNINNLQFTIDKNSSHLSGGIKIPLNY